MRHYKNTQSLLSQIRGLSPTLAIFAQSAVEAKWARRYRKGDHAPKRDHRAWLLDKMAKQPEFSGPVMDIFDNA